MATWALKISKPGVDVGTASVSDLLFHSDYSMFKVHSDGSQVGTIQAGQSAGTLTFTHNLGYVPAYIPYYRDTSGNLRLLGGVREGIGISGGIYVYAGTSTITCVYDLGSAYNKIGPLGWVDAYETQFGLQAMQVGQDDGLNISSGVTYYPVNISNSATIGTATLDVYINIAGTNTADGTVSTHGRRDDYSPTIGDLNAQQTSGSAVQNVAGLGTGQTFGVNVTEIVQEIVNRPSWASGTGMTFYIRNVNFPNEKWFYEGLGSTRLTVIQPGSVTFAFRMLIFKDKVF